MTMPPIENRWTTGNVLALGALLIQLIGFGVGVAFIATGTASAADWEQITP